VRRGREGAKVYVNNICKHGMGVLVRGVGQCEITGHVLACRHTILHDSQGYQAQSCVFSLQLRTRCVVSTDPVTSLVIWSIYSAIYLEI
jgi:hypothetical protein